MNDKIQKVLSGSGGNGVSAGIQIVPVYRYDISGLMKAGQNEIAIEVAATLERVAPRKSRIPGRPVPLLSNRCGICGGVNLWVFCCYERRNRE